MNARTRIVALSALLLIALLIGLAGNERSAQALDKTVRQQVLRASVKLLTPFDADPNAGSLCSGTMLNQEGYILTNYHCIGYTTSGGRDRELERLGLEPGDLYNQRGLTVIAITDDPRQLPKPTYIAQVLSGSSDLDLAVLKIVAYYNSKQKLTPTLPVVSIPLADSDTVETLDEVFVIGYPGIAGDTVTATEGKISGFLDEDGDDRFDWFKTDVLVNQGNSGGSAVNDKGELIGVPTLRLQDKTGNIIYLIRPTNIAVPFIQQAMKAGGSNADLNKGPAAPATVPAGQNIGPITFGTGFDDARGVTGVATSFESGIREIHGGVPYQDMENGTAWGYMWLLDGKNLTGQSNLRWDFGPSGVLDLYLRGKNGLSDGTYHLQVFLRGKLAREGQFTIGRPQARPTPEKPSTDQDNGVLVTGTILDYSTRKPIQGAIIIFLYPGLTIEDFDNDTSDGKSQTVISYGVANAQGQFTTNAPLPRGYIYSALVGAKGYQRIAEDDALEIAEDDPDLIELNPIYLERW